MKKFQLISMSNKLESHTPNLIKLLPLGHVMSQKGNFDVDNESFETMKKYFNGRGLDLVVDYEHQTLENVQAPASGWIKDLILKEDGIYGAVEWTKKAKEYLENNEYRYLSPVVLVRCKDKKAIVLHSVALTNTPAIDKMQPIINSIDVNELNLQEFEGGNKMDLAILIKLLGLAEDATEEDIKKAIADLQENNKDSKTDLVANKAVLELLDLKDDASQTDVTAKITALKNPRNYVPMEMFNKLADKVKLQEQKEIEDTVELALKQGKIMPAQKEWAVKYALKDITGFKSFLEQAPEIVPMGENGNLYSPKNKSGDDVQISINKQLGISEADIEKYGKDED
ncbi:phage protease [Vallitalea guaymasensis]|uniref:phage protease n=1 Tax=Vallitalea guaymasensis TaxID=1185412 RepID=UPI000DE3E28D|nr:phage protease [Vallitalea guaymasensis]